MRWGELVDAGVVLAAVVAVVASLGAVCRTRGGMRPGWVAVALAAPLFAAGELAEGAPAGVLLRVLAYVAMALAIVLAPGVRRSLREWALLLLDGWMMGGSVFLLVWTFAAHPTLTGRTGPGAGALAEVAVDVLAASVVVGLAGRTQRADIAPSLFIVGCTASLACTDLLALLAASVPALRGTSHLLAVLTLLLLAATPLSGRLDPWASTSSPRPSYARVPHLVVGAACALTVAAVGLGRAPDPLLAGFGASLLLALVAQVYLLLRDNATLYRDLEQQAARTGALLTHSSDVIVLTDLAGQVRYVSPALRAVYGYDPATFTGEMLLGIVHHADERRVRRQVQAVLDAGGGATRLQCRLRHADGRWLFAESSLATFVEDGAVTGLVVNSRDVTDRVVLEDELAHRAAHDELTGLANRRRLVDHLERTLRQPVLLGSRLRVGVLYLDLDGFKAVNDTAGHAAGDGLLAEVARRLRAELRPEDLVARFGGDEFAAVLEGVTPDEALAVAGRLREVLGRPYVVDGRELVVRASVGVAFAVTGTPTGDLLRNADLAMYRAKAAGRDRVEVYVPQMHADLVERVDLEGRLRRAVEDGAFELHFQPVVDMSDGSVPRVEALVRWRREDGTLAMPGEFIEVAEESGTVVAIGRWVLREALRQCRAWDDLGLHLALSVNLSARQVAEPGVVDEVLAALQEAGVGADRLTLEVTESALLESMELSRQRLAVLRAAGVTVALDDFGTGYSGLAYLRGLTVDHLKLDRSFVAGLGVEHERTVLVRTLVRLGHELGLVVVAEGVETAEQVALLRQTGCRLAQGYLFSPPVPAADVPALAVRGFADEVAALRPLPGPRPAAGPVPPPALAPGSPAGPRPETHVSSR